MKLKRSRKRTAKWNLFFSYFLQGQTFILGIVMVPLYLYYLPLAEYGAWLATGNVLLWLTLMDPGLNNVVKQRVAAAYGAKNNRAIAAYANAGLLISGLIGVLVCGAGQLVAPHLGDLLKLSPEVAIVLEPVFRLAVLGSALSLFSFGLSSVSSGLQASLGQGLILNVATGCYIITIFILLRLGAGLYALAIAQVVRGALLCLGHAGYLTWRVRSDCIPWNFRTDKITEMFSLSLYTFSARVINGLNANLSLFLVARFISAEFVAVYDLTRRAPKFCRSFLSNPINIFVPIIAEMHGAGDHEKIRRNVLRLGRFLIWTLGLYTAGFVALNESFVNLWVGSEQYAGDAITFLICLNAIVAIFLYALLSCALSLGDIKKSNAVQLIQGIVILPAFYFGIKYYGVVGLLVAPIVPQLLIGFPYYLRTLPEKLGIGWGAIWDMLLEVGKVIAASLAGVLLVRFFEFDSWFEFIVFAVLVVLVFGGVLSLVSSACRYEIKGLLGILKNKIKIV